MPASKWNSGIWTLLFSEAVSPKKNALYFIIVRAWTCTWRPEKREQLFPEGGLDKEKTDYGYLVVPVVGKPTNTNQRLNVYVLFLMYASINFRVQCETSHCQSLRVLTKFRKSCFPWISLIQLSPLASGTQLGFVRVWGTGPALALPRTAIRE